MLKEDTPRRPMPDGLRQRLRDIPHREVVCRDVERLYRTTLARARGDAESCDNAAEKHLSSCAHCRELYDTLYDAFAAARRPLPARLSRRLADIARHPEQLVPIWISDTRYAAAACYLLAALALTLAGDASALFEGTTRAVSSKAAVWADAGEARGLETWDAVTSTVGKGIDTGWNKARGYGAAGERLFADALETIETRTNQLIPDRERSVEGEKDGGRNDGS